MKRFWKQAGNAPAEGGHAIHLDGRPVKTPARAPLVLPGAALAEAVAAEWNAAGEKIDPAQMPMTGFANAAIDRVAAEREGFVAEVANYAVTDLLCYRADSPAELVERQQAAWDPVLGWARGAYGVDFVTVAGVMHAPQPAPTLAAIREAVAARSDFELAALARLTTLSGSVVASLALAEGAFDAETLWRASLIEELWQEEQWGDDDTALAHRAGRAREYMDAARFLSLVQAG